MEMNCTGYKISDDEKDSIVYGSYLHLSDP
jgi:hypothetical protein